MKHLVDLFKILKALKSLEKRGEVVAYKDPTMIFSGVVWGPEIFIEKKLMHCLWPLKTAMFQHGDRLIEKVIDETSIDDFKAHFLKHNHDKEGFYLFSTKYHDCHDHSEMKRGYEECKANLKKYFPEVGDKILADWVNVTNKAIQSTFTIGDWKQNMLSGSSQELWRICRDEEDKKNVNVVTSLIEGARHLKCDFAYSKDSSILITACSRWFTLIDDYLDLLADIELEQPNYIYALLVEHGELETFTKSDDSSIKNNAPKTQQAYDELLKTARHTFKNEFPVLPSFFAWWIESQAEKKAKSPF